MNPFDPSQAGTNIFDIYNDASIVARQNVPRLPGGSCNFVDISPGANGARCGCRRFWIRSAVGSPILDSAGWCMCNHHACFHDQGDRLDDLVPRSRGAGQENERPRTGREPLSPMLELSLKLPTGLTGQDLVHVPAADPFSFLYHTPGPHFENHAISPAAPAQPSGSLPDTSPWDAAIQSTPLDPRIPPIPSQCLFSQTASTTSSVQARYLRPFGGKGLNTLDKPKIQASSPLRSGQVSRVQEAEADSFVLVSQDQLSVDQGTATQVEPRAIALEGVVMRESFKNLSDAVAGHEQRLDRLETISFSAASHDECHEKHDHLDLRVADLESRIDDVEKLGKADRNDDATTQSLASFATNESGRPLQSQELYSQIQSLQAQVTTLQSALPSYNHAWEVEIVFLPFPLKRLWQSIDQFKSDSSSIEDGWTQLPMTHSTATLRSQSPFYGDWASSEHDAEWLLPRACGDKTVIDRRLRSRGLIQTVSVKGPDARSVNMAVHSAFGALMQQLAQQSRSSQSDPRFARFLGLHSPWVPLRKIHKDSRLRFLSPGEMLTPANWDVQFLNSVMMRSSEPRLFVTHPDAYLQDIHAYETGWTWQRVREMTRVYPDVTESQEVPEADAMEEYWSWNEQLDDSPDANTSMSLRQERIRSESPQLQLDAVEQPWRSSSPTVASGHQSSTLKGRRGSRPPHIRTTSVPAAAPVNYSPATLKRRVVSHGQSRHSSPSIRATSQFAVVKRRSTRSPSYARFTPRWTASPSPMPMALSERQLIRGHTPFGYATPYSNDPGPLADARSVREGSAMPMVFNYEFDDDDEQDEDYDIEIYESGSDEGTDESDVSLGLNQPMSHIHSEALRDSRHAQQPEDEPWPGIEDRARLSDGENIDPAEADRQSRASSQPSEYPSTQRGWPNDGAGFHIHEDE